MNILFNFKKMASHLHIIRKWSSISETLLVKILLMFNNNSQKYRPYIDLAKSAFLYYIQSLKNSPINIAQMTPGEMLSGLAFFVSMFVVNFIYNGSQLKIEPMWDFVLFYLYFDHQLDSNKSTSMYKKMMISQVIDYTQDPEQSPSDPIFSKYCGYVKNPVYQFYLFRVFLAEIFGLRFQMPNLPLTRTDYLNIAVIKGGTTTEAMAVMMDIPPKDLSLFGACIQVFDDLMDVDQDLERKTETIATHDKRQTNYVDNTFIDLVILIDQLPTNLNLIKMIMIDSLIILTQKQPNSLSPTLINDIQSTLNINPATISLLGSTLSSACTNFANSLKSNP